jgi:hypothetical protein
MDTPKPGDFPIGSVESRAAMRLQLVSLRDMRGRVEYHNNIRRPGQDGMRFDFGAWQDCQDGKLFRWVYVPHVWLKPGEAVPACPDCRTPFAKTSESPNLVGYSAGCMKLHDPERVA